MYENHTLELFPEFADFISETSYPKHEFTFIDLFAGIGGFHLALHSIGGTCVFASEKDAYARQTYQKNLKVRSNSFNEDIRTLSPEDVPDHDILCAGFPCQPFSQAGNKKGFNDGENSERGNLFFCIIDILEAKRPKAFILENVRHLIAHDNGKTLAIILAALKDADYEVSYKILKASDFNVPQHRPRVFFVGFDKRQVNINTKFHFPANLPLTKTMTDIFNAPCDKKIGFTIRVGGKGSKIDDRRNWEFYRVNNEVRRIDLSEAQKMMSFPDNFQFPVSKTQALKQLGNSVCMEVVKHVGMSVLKYLDKNINNLENSTMQNKGEISEGYVILKIIHDKVIQYGNENGLASDEVIRVLKIKNGTKDIHIKDISVEIISENGFKQSIPIHEIITQKDLNDTILFIKGQSGTFECEPLESVKRLIDLEKGKGTSFEKADTHIDFQDHLINSNQGISIKSFIGSSPTLLNASSATNFIYEVQGLDINLIDEINKIDTSAKIKDRLAKIIVDGGALSFSHCENSIYQSNLRKCDSLMPQIIADALLSFFLRKNGNELSNYKPNTLKILSLSQEEIHFRLKDFIKYTIFGIFPTKEWNGNLTANGAIIVDKKGDLIFYHTNNDATLKNYFYQNCFFDTPSSTRHRFGSLYKENGKLYFKLNLQLRLKG